ncbi:MAG: type II secretion system GspH family protein [Synergistaceae bacterium]|nr:type II secretion system GspH family protein [Synergistaceae bacterium]
MKVMSRKGGFTLVELLIVIMIIAILAGMMMLATGSATDGAEATKVINDLRNLKGAALMFFIDEQEWPTATAASSTSLDRYMDRAFLTSSPSRYVTLIVTSGDSGGGVTRSYIGVTLRTNETHREGVQKKLAGNAKNSGLWTAPGHAYVTGANIFMSMN